MTVRPSVGVLKLTFKGVLPQKPARILRPTRQWESNLDWTTDDVLQLTLGEEDVQWELKGSDVASMSIDDIKLPWKVHTLMKYFVVPQHAEACPTLDEDYHTTDVCNRTSTYGGEWRVSQPISMPSFLLDESTQQAVNTAGSLMRAAYTQSDQVKRVIGNTPLRLPSHADARQQDSSCFGRGREGRRRPGT